MITLTITSNATEVNAFMVHVQGQLTDRRGLNAELGSRLADELQDHFRSRSSEPNKMGAPSTNFWEQMAESTQVAEITDDGATVAVADVRIRIHVFGGTIKPTGGRKFLTIPLVKEARGLKGPSDYEDKTGHKLFRLPGTKVLVERTQDQGPSNFRGGKVRTRTKGGEYRDLTIRGRSLFRAVYALATEANFHKDPRALPPTAALIAALTESGNQYLKSIKS